MSREMRPSPTYSAPSKVELDEDGYPRGMWIRRGDRAERRVRLAGETFASLADLLDEALELHADGWVVDYLVARIECVRDQLRNQAEFFGQMTEVEQ